MLSNGTPPAVIHTLSLHDALPISVVVRDGPSYVGGLGAIVREGVLGRTILAMPFATYGGPIVRRGHDPAALRRRLLEDRKSTRLNSSHRTSSYAVFCLKKKR